MDNTLNFCMQIQLFTVPFFWILFAAQLTRGISACNSAWLCKEQFQRPAVIELRHWWAIDADLHAGCKTLALQPVSQVCLYLHIE